MLRLLHTGDWHLGHSFHGYDRDEEHAAFLEWLLKTLVERQADALLVAGDVFDSVNPPASAQRRLYDFLARAHAAVPGLQVVVIAGNHDAAARLEAPAGLLESLRIAVVGTVPRDEAGEIDCGRFIVPLRDAGGEVAAFVLAIPFLRPSDVPEVEGAADAYLDGVRELHRRIIAAAVARREREAPGAALVAMGHCHLQEAAESRDSERRLVIGGAEALAHDVFSHEIAYAALGHLHRPQDLGGGRIRYCGSPIPLSFSEKDYAHRVVEVLIDGSGCAEITSLPVPKTVTLLRLPVDAAASVEEVLRVVAEMKFDAALVPGAHPYLELRIMEEGPDPTRRARIEQALAGLGVRLASIKLERRERTAGLAEAAVETADLGTLDPEEIMVAAHRERFGAEPDAALMAALREILTTVAHA